MRQTFFVLFLFVIICSCNTSKKARSSAAPGVWQSTPIVIDGDAKDWPSPYPSYDATAMVGYAMSNDKDNLYLTVEAGDDLTQLKILREGLTVWIDTSAGKNQSVAIHFPQTNEDEPLQLKSEHTGTSKQDFAERAFKQKILKALDGARRMELDGFSGCSGAYLIKQNDDCGIVVRIGMDEYNELIWEAQIPFKAFYSKAQLDRSDLDKTISVCFAVKGVKKPSGGNNNNTSGTGMNNGGGMRGGGAGGMGGGGSRGGHGGGGHAATSNPYERLFESTKTWKTFKLAFQG